MLSRRFNKVLTVFAVLCDEIHELRLAAENEFYPALAVFGMPPHESDGGLNAALDKEPPVPTMSHIAKHFFSDRARCVAQLCTATARDRVLIPARCSAVQLTGRRARSRRT